MSDEKRIALDLHIIDTRLDDIWEKVKNKIDLEDIREDVKVIALDLKFLYKDLGGGEDGLF